MPIVSIIMSVYNTEEYLEKAIESVLNQTFTDYEFIIVNNGSTDGSSKIIEKFKNNDERIVLIENEKNKFLSEARNQALTISKGKYIYVIDSDDYIEENTLETILSIAEQDELDLVVFGWFMEYYFENEFISLPVKPEYLICKSQIEFRDNAINYLNQSILTVPWNKLYKKEVIDKFHVCYRNTKLEDHHFNMDYIKDISKVGFISTPFYHYFRSRPGSELNFIYKFDLFQKKKEHFLHTKEIFEYWKIENEKTWVILHTYFAERIVQCIQEIMANDAFSKREKNIKINEIFNDKDAKISIKKAKSQSLMLRLMLIPLKARLKWLCKLEASVITWYKTKHNDKFVRLRANKVNKSKV